MLIAEVVLGRRKSGGLPQLSQTTQLMQSRQRLQRCVGRLSRSKAMDCLVEALAGNVRQARLMKKHSPLLSLLRGALRIRQLDPRRALQRELGHRRFMD